MSLTVMMVVLFAALLHASWNFLVKRADDKYLSMSAMVVGHLPFALGAALWAPMPRGASLPFLFTGAMLHVGYQLFLLSSYRFGDLSQVYPLARGVAPLLVAGVSVLFLHLPLSTPELCAVAMIAGGIMSLTLVRRADGLRNARAAVLALFTGAFIASYSLVDGMGARAAGTALGFYGWLSIVNGLVFVVIMGRLRPGTVKKLVLCERRLALCCGGASFTAYALVIWAFTQAPIALVSALRETSIIFALLLGVFMLKERLDRTKVLATLVTLLGVGLLRLSR